MASRCSSLIWLGQTMNHEVKNGDGLRGPMSPSATRCQKQMRLRFCLGKVDDGFCRWVWTWSVQILPTRASARPETVRAKIWNIKRSFPTGLARISYVDLGFCVHPGAFIHFGVRRDSENQKLNSISNFGGVGFGRGLSKPFPSRRVQGPKLGQKFRIWKDRFQTSLARISCVRPFQTLCPSWVRWFSENKKLNSISNFGGMGFGRGLSEPFQWSRE